MARDGTKTGGRRAGAPNKRTQELIDLVEEKYPGYNLVLGMVTLAHDEMDALKDGSIVSIEDLMAASESDNPNDFKYLVDKLTASKKFALDALKEAAPYLYAKRKAIEISNDPENPIPDKLTLEMSQEHATQLYRQIIKKSSD